MSQIYFDSSLNEEGKFLLVKPWLIPILSSPDNENYLRILKSYLRNISHRESSISEVKNDLFKSYKNWESHYNKVSGSERIRSFIQKIL